MKMFGSMFGSRRAGKVDNVPSSTTDRDDTHVSSGEAVTSRKRSDSIDSDHKVKVYAEVGNIDFNHEAALTRQLKDCSDEQLITELARRQVDIRHKVTTDLVAEYYSFEKVLGEGASGKVYLVTKRGTREKFACKMIRKDGEMNDAESMNTEIDIMKHVRHDNVVTLFELFESPKCMWLILELVDGAGLRGALDKAVPGARFKEPVAARYVKQICAGLHYLHTRGVVHRDLKIDNILLSAHGDVAKIADFGLSALVGAAEGYDGDVSQKRKTFTGLRHTWGTPTHYAPELIDKAYGPQADLWSLGCVIYEMLTGEEAFPIAEGMQRKALYEIIQTARYSRKTLVSLGISLEAQDLLAKLFVVDPRRRLSAAEVLKHPWIVKQTEKSGPRQSRHTFELASLPSIRGIRTEPNSPANSPESGNGSGTARRHAVGGRHQALAKPPSGKERLEMFKQGHAAMGSVLSDLRAALPAGAGVDSTGARRTSLTITPANSRRVEDDRVGTSARVSTKPSPPLRKLSGGPTLAAGGASTPDAGPSRRSTLESGITDNASIISALESP